MARQYCTGEKDWGCWLTVIVIVVLVSLPLVGIFAILAVTVGDMAPHYFAAIDSVSGLDSPGGNLTLADPLFNVTLRVTTRGFLRHDCVAPGSVVEVSYAGVPLATGRARGSCARVGTSRRQRVVARGADVRVPRFALDGLAADARRGLQTFDVVVRMPSTHDNGDEATLVSCSGLRVGDAAALRSPCFVSHVDAVMPAASDVNGGGST